MTALNEIIDRLGWTLVHSLWIGAAAAFLHGALMVMLRRNSAQARYAAGCTILALFMGGVMAAFVEQRPTGHPPAFGREQQRQTVRATNEFPALALPAVTTPTPPPVVAKEPVSAQIHTSSAHTAPGPVPAVPLRERAVRVLEPVLPWAALAWATGATILALQQLAGWIGLRRLRRHSRPVQSELVKQVAHLAHHLGIRQAVTVVESGLVRVPAVVGWWKPVILLPAGLALGLSAAQLEAILLHELSHIRRHDYLVNLVQTFIETLLFYHPATWLISRQIRREREHCCDDAVIALGTDGRQYAESLLQVARQSSLRRPNIGIAATGKTSELRRRIARLLREDRSRSRTWPIAALALFAIALLVPLACMRGTTTPPTPAATSDSAEVLALRNAIQSGTPLEKQAALQRAADDKIMALVPDMIDAIADPTELPRDGDTGWGFVGHQAATLLGRSIAPAVDGNIAEGSKFSFANDMHLGPKALRENGRLNEVQGNWRTWWTANKEKALAIYDWPAKLRPDSLVGLWILRRTDNPGPTEANIYEMLLNADKTWAEMAVWGDPAKPTKVEVDSQGSDWSLVCDAFGEWHLMRWANAAHSSGASTHIISAKTSEFTLLIGNGIRITQKYERASAPERAAVQPFLAASAVKMEAPPPVPTPLDWPGTPDLSRIAGTWFSDQQSRDATGAEEFVFLTIEKSGPWRLGQFFGSPDAPVRVQTDQQGPDWRLAGSSIYFHRPPLPTGGDAGFTAAVERLTNNEMKLSPRNYQRASPQLTAILLGKAAASPPATTDAAAARVEYRDLFPICDQTKWGYIDPTGKIAIHPAYEDARFFSEGLAAVRRNGKYGYIDKTGKLIIPPQFQYGFDFHEGLAWVDDGSGSGFIDQTGKIVLRAPAGMYCREFHDGLALAQTLQFMDGPQALTNLPHKAGFIDKTGNFAIEPRFDAAMDFAEGLAAVFTNGKWGFIDKTGKLVMAAKYDGAAYFSEGLACVRQGNKTIVIDKLGQQPFPKSFDDAALFKEGLCSVKIGEKWGFIDTAGTLVIPPQFDDGTSYLNGRAPVAINKKHGYIDKTGHIIIPPTYAYAHFFLGDLAGVSLDPLKSDGSNYIYINARGEVIWQPAATQTTKSAAEDRESAAIKALAEKALAMTPQNSRPVTGHSEQRPTSLDFTTILEATGQAKDFAAFPQDHRFFQDTTQQLAREGKIWALAALLDHENVDAKVYSARGLLACADARSMPALLAAAKANAYVVSGSENATLHMIYRETLKQAMEKITGLKLTPLGLHVTEYPKPNEPRDISSDEHPERFGEDADFQKVERWMTEKFGVKATTATATHGPKDDPALDDPDVAALLTAIKPQAGWKLERKEGTVQPINLEPGHGIELAFPQTKPANPKVIPLTIWIMDANYAAGPAPQLTGSGTPVAGKARELARWNGRRIFLFDSGDKGWTDAAARIEGSLKATSGPLVAALVVDKADGKDNLQFELRNRSEQEVKVCSTPWPGGGHDVGFGVYQIDFFPAVTLSDNPPPEWWRTRVVTLKPGESLHWPVNYPPMTPGSHLKLDACYGTLFDASEIGIWDGSAIAPTVDVRVDETGRVTIAPWKPAVISPEVSAVSQRVGTQMQRWVGDLDQELKSVADGIYPQIFADPDSKAEVTDLSCVVQLNTRWGASDSPRQFTGDLPQLTLRVSAMRLGEWNDLALATESAQAKWDGNAIFRQYRLPGSTWVISLAAQANNPALAQKANDVLDAAYDKLAKIAADAAQESPANPTLQEPSATAFEHPESLAGQALKAAGIIESRGPAKVHANEEDGVVGHFWEVAENAPERRWLNVWADAQGVIVEANYAAQPGYCAGRDLQAMAERLPKEAGGTWQMEPINVLPVTQPILRGQESTEPGKVQAGYDVFPFGLDRFESSLGASYKSANPAAIHILGSARFITVLEGRDLSKAEPASTVKLVKALGLHRIAEIEAKQSDIVPDGGVPYLLPGGAIYKEGGTGPAEADTSAAWERANEFVFRTALRKAYKLPGLDARDTGDTRGYVVHFTALDSGAPLQVEVAQDLKLVRLPRAPAPPAAATRP